MPHVVFTQNLTRHVACPRETVVATNVRAALEAYFERHPGVRGYVLDEQNLLRKHVVVFVDGRQVRDRASLGDELGDDAEVYVMQALSGG